MPALARTVLPVSLAMIAGAFVSFGMLRRSRTTPPPPLPPLYTAPPMAPVTPTTAGDLAWEPVARSPILADVNHDGVEDIFGFFRIWDGLSAWALYAGAFDGATDKPIWRTDVLDPQIIKRRGVVPCAVVAGSRVVVSDGTSVLRVYTVVSGEKEATLQLEGAVMDLCRAPGIPSRVWINVDGGRDTLVELDTMKSHLAPRPAGCLPRSLPSAPLASSKKKSSPEDLAAASRQEKACEGEFQNSLLATASCRPVGAHRGVADAGLDARYELTDGPVAILLGTRDARPFAQSVTDSAAWVSGFVSDDTKAKPEVPAVADIAFGRLYAVYEKVYFDARLAALDARTGRSLWDVPLPGSLPDSEGRGRGTARGLVATPFRVYVVRAGGALDVFDAANGKSLASIGKQ